MPPFGPCAYAQWASTNEGGCELENEQEITVETKGLSRRQLIQRGLVIGGAIWIPPVVQSLRMPAAAATGSPAPCTQDTGTMTGSGYAYISGTSGRKVHYVTGGQLSCAPAGSNNLSVTWDNGLKGQNTINYEFDLTSITSITCSANPSYPIGPNANFNETSGTGTGTFLIDNVAQPGSATITFDLIDGGEPGIGNDHVTIIIQYPGSTTVLSVVNQPLTAGNLQTHGNTAFGNACP